MVLYTFNIRMQDAGTRASLWAPDQSGLCIELQVGQSCTGTACSQNKQTNKTHIIFRVLRSISRTHTKSYISHYRISILLNSLQRSEENLCDFFSFLPPPLPSSFLACVFIFSIVRKPRFDYEFRWWISWLIILPLRPWGPNETDPKGQPSAQLGYVNTSSQQENWQRQQSGFGKSGRCHSVYHAAAGDWQVIEVPVPGHHRREAASRWGQLQRKCHLKPPHQCNDSKLPFFFI